MKAAPVLAETFPEGERVYSVQRVSDQVAKNHLRLNALLNVAIVAAIVVCSLVLPWVEFPQDGLMVGLWVVEKTRYDGSTRSYALVSLLSESACVQVADEQGLCANMFFFFLGALGYSLFVGLGGTLNLYGVFCILNIVRGTKNKHLVRTFMVKYCYLFYWVALAIWIAVSRMIVYIKYLRLAPLCVFLVGVLAFFTRWHFKVYKGRLQRKRDINYLLSAE